MADEMTPEQILAAAQEEDTVPHPTPTITAAGLKDLSFRLYYADMHGATPGQLRVEFFDAGRMTDRAMSELGDTSSTELLLAKAVLASRTL